MGWFSKKSHETPQTAENSWAPCPKCKKLVSNEEWSVSHNVCPKCNFHGKINAYERIAITIDDGTFIEINETIRPNDPLSFTDSKSYKDRIAEARKKTGLNESIVTGTGKIDAKPVVIGVMDFRFMGGSLGSGTGEKILQAANYAYEHRVPLIIFTASGGARMQEGILSLMQMAKTCAAISRLQERKIPYLSVLTDPTTGGVSASFAMVGDVHLSEPGALIAFAGRRVIEQTIRQKLPDDFQTAEYLVEHGFVDHIASRKDMKVTISRILSFYNR